MSNGAWFGSGRESGAADPFKSYFGALEQTTQALDPLMKGFTRCQLEMFGLMSRRAQAYMEIPTRLTQCRSPQELFAEQTRFWTQAFQQYTETSQRMMSAFAQMATPGAQGNGGGASTRARDYRTLPETGPGAARRAA